MIGQNALIFYKWETYYNIFFIFVFIALLAIAYSLYFLKKIKQNSSDYKVALEENRSLEKVHEIHREEEKKIKEEMIAQEKMASLGSMVDGIAHEVNNPLGICLTTISAFDEKANKVLKLFEEEKMSKNQLKSFLDFSQSSAKSIQLNLETAINTINGFRILADNPVNEFYESLQIENFLNEIKTALKYELKKKSVKVDIVCKEAFVFYGSRGPLTQIFTNLILNSLIHGFKETDQPIITIKCALINNYVVIEYRDNGSGIPDEVRDKIFNIFYTTRRKEGGSGLGLHIVKTLLKEKFDGVITSDETEIGALFTIEFPNKEKEMSEL